MVTEVTSRSVGLSWDPPESNSFELVLTGYTVSWNSDSTIITAPDTVAFISNLVPFEVYLFSVYTNYQGGNFGESISIAITTLQDGKHTIFFRTQVNYKCCSPNLTSNCPHLTLLPQPPTLPMRSQCQL